MEKTQILQALSQLSVLDSARFPQSPSKITGI